ITRILENVGRVLPHDTANILLLEGTTARAAYWQGYPTQELPFISGLTFDVDQLPNLRQMIDTGLPCFIADTALDPNWVTFPEAPVIASYIGAPIKVSGEVIGFLDLNSQMPGFFSNAQLGRLQAFADLAAIAIQNARLYERLRMHAAELEERVEQRT